MEAGEKIIVGVNAFREEDEPAGAVPRIAPSVEGRRRAVETGNNVLDRRHIARQREAPVILQRDDLQLARLNRGVNLRVDAIEHRNLARDGVLKRLRAGLVGHVHHVHTCGKFEHLRGHVVGGADTRGAVGNLAGKLFRVIDQLAH